MLGIEAEVVPARIDEARGQGERPGPYVERLAREKARSVAEGRPGCLVLGGDTTVVDRGDVLEKPRDEADALAMLTRLAGRTHEVLTGMALVGPGGNLESLTRAARVTFRSVPPADLRRYVATGEPMDKAGAYGIQGLGAALVDAVEGDYYAVVGLSVAGLVQLLDRVGFRYACPGVGRG